MEQRIWTWIGLVGMWLFEFLFEVLSVSVKNTGISMAQEKPTYYELNREKMLTYQHEYKAKNPDVVRKKNRQCKRRQKPTIFLVEKKVVVKFD